MALILALAFLLLAVAGRIAIQIYHTGDHGVRFAGLSARWSEILPGSFFVLSFAFHLVLVVAHSMGLLKVSIATPEWMQITGLLTGLTGIAVTLIAQWQMGEAWRIGVDAQEKTALITHGLYARSRNPIYFGIFVYWFGISIVFPHPLMWVCAVICAICVHIIVRAMEEPYLRALHGEAFTGYWSRTNRYWIL